MQSPPWLARSRCPLSTGFPPRGVPLSYAGRFLLISLLKYGSFGATPCLVKGRAVPTMGNPLPWRGNSADLLQHAKGVVVEPGFLDLATCEAHDGYARDRHALAAWGNAHEGALVGAGRRPA